MFTVSVIAEQLEEQRNYENVIIDKHSELVEVVYMPSFPLNGREINF